MLPNWQDYGLSDIVSGQTMLQIRPNDASSHSGCLADFFGGDRNPEGRRSRKPSLRPQGAQVFARLPCPREEGASEKGSDRRNQARQQGREEVVPRDPGANRL